MIIHRTALSLAVVTAFALPGAAAHARSSPGPAGGGEARVPAGFSEQTAQLGDVAINYVRGGSGPTLVLLHGFPQNWYEWRSLLPALAEHYTVIAPDLRGAGGSDAPETGYDKKTMAADLHGLLTELGLQRDIRLVGHDIGTMVAYAYAAAHPDEVNRLVLSEAPIPDESIYTFPSLTAKGPGLWNFGFFSNTNGLPEEIIEGREDLWVQLFINALAVHKDAIGPADIERYADPLRDAAHLRASFEWFRALPRDVRDTAEYGKAKLPMPVLAIGASGSLGDSVRKQVQQYADNVTGVVIEDSGHWIYEEQTGQMLQLLLEFLH